MSVYVVYMEYWWHNNCEAKDARQRCSLNSQEGILYSCAQSMYAKNCDHIHFVVINVCCQRGQQLLDNSDV